MQEVKLYTDGACSGNPGPGGCAAILIFGENRKQLHVGYKLTTNNRMELMAVIIGLEALKRKDVKVIIYSDSKYVINSFEKGWVYNWEKENFRHRINADLFIKLLELYRSFSEIEFVWVKGHSGDPENEMCDAIAVNMSKHLELQIKDDGYIPKE